MRLPDLCPGRLRRHPQPRPEPNILTYLSQITCPDGARQPKSSVVAKILADDGGLPIRSRVRTLRAAHRPSYGGRLDPLQAHWLEHAYAERPSQVAAALEAYRWPRP